MAIVKDPVTQTTGDIGAQNQSAYQQDVLGAQNRAQRLATSTGNATTNIVNKSTVNPVLDASAVSKVSPMTVSATPQATGFSGLGGSIEEMAKQYANTVVEESKVAQEKQAKDNSLSGLVSKLRGKKGENQLKDEASAPIDLAKKELNDVNNQIIQEQVGQRRMVEDIQKNKERYTGNGMQIAIERANRDSVSKQADLAVIQMAKQNNYSSAKEIADRKVAAQLEEQKMEIDALQFDYEQNKEQYTKSEQRQFEAQQSERKRLLDSEETKLKAINDLAIEAAKNGADIATIKAIQGSTDINSALVAGARYMKAPKSGGGSSTKNNFYTEKNIPADLKAEIIANIEAGADTNEIYKTYSDVDSDYIASLIEKITPNDTTPEQTITENKKQFTWWNPTTWF